MRKKTVPKEKKKKLKKSWRTEKRTETDQKINPDSRRKLRKRTKGEVGKENKKRKMKESPSFSFLSFSFF